MPKLKANEHTIIYMNAEQMLDIELDEPIMSEGWAEAILGIRAGAGGAGFYN